MSKFLLGVFLATLSERQEEDKIFNHVSAEKPELKEGVETKYSDVGAEKSDLKKEVKSKYSDGHYDTRDHTKELKETRIHLSGSLQVFLPSFFLF